MNKIRINVLARELEVKAHELLDKLPELGVTEKKTHSSSVDDDVADKLRRIFGPGGSGEPQAAASSNGAATARVEEPAMEPERAEVPQAPAREAAQPEATHEPAAPSEEKAPPRVAPPQPQRLRPPLAASPAVPGPPRTPAPGPASRPMGPVRPIPSAPRPGQILSGPRQPLPGGVRPPEPVRMSSGPAPSPAARTTAPATQAPGAPASPAPPMPVRSAPARPGLAGQPAVRPVVPPRPDLAAKLSQSRPATPGAPAAARPGIPSRAQSSPVPGQPIYRGPIRPGQPIMARPGPAARTGPPGFRPAGPRPMHPTSRGMVAPGIAPPPMEQPRRPGDNRRGARPQRDRVVEREEKILRPTVRRETPSGPPPVNREITISEGITVKELSEKLDVKASLVIKKLVDRNIFATINQTLDSKLATELSREFGASTATVSFEEEAMHEVETAQEEKDQVKRAPVVTIMGHVDHGKTSLLDSIRQARVAEKEAGGITQHIGAYQVEKNGRKIVFIDTPGHEAFTRMRSRGAKVTDIVVLVVAADDGVMPQTIEAIDHARAAKVPIIVAINKIDRPDAQPDRIKQQLSDRGLLAEDWGGDVVMVPVSAKMKIGLDLLLEMILLVADLQDLRANPQRPAMGSVLEAKLDRGRGPVATVLVRNGTLRVGDYFICGSVFGKVRAMLNDLGEQVREAEPSTPVEVLGLEDMPEAGDTFQVVSDTVKAKQIVVYRESKAREQALGKSSRLTLEQLHKQLEAGEIKELPIILKTDVGGSAEVLSDTLQKLSNDKVRVRVLRSGVGAITESDVLLALTSNAIVIGFNVRPERNAEAIAEQEKIDIRLHTIIYNLIDEIKQAMTGLLAPVFREVYQGKAEVRDTFRISKVGLVAGCLVQDGHLTRGSAIRLLRDNVVIHTGKVGSLRRFKDDVSEVRSGMECGVTIENFSDVKPRDIIEAFVTEKVAPEVFA